MPKTLERLALHLLLALPLAAAAGLLDSNEGEFLPVDEAFTFDALAVTADQIEARWLIAPGYYLYRHRLDVRLVPEQAAELDWQVPAGTPAHDEHFGDVEIYRDQLSLPLHIDTARDTVTLEFRYQGCADAGLCYPPQTRRLSLELPARQ